MPADIALPISIPTNTPDVGRGADRESVVNQPVSDGRQSFNDEYRRQMDAQQNRYARHQAQQQRQQDARQADVRADLQAEKQAENARRLARENTAEQREAERRSGKRLPDQGNTRPRQGERTEAHTNNSREQDVESQKSREASSTQNSSTDISRTSSDTSATTSSQQTRSMENVQRQGQQVSDRTSSDTESSPNAETALTPYIVQQLSEKQSVTEQSVEGGDVESESNAENPNALSSLKQWMDQTLGGSEGETLHGSEKALSGAVASSQEGDVDGVDRINGIDRPPNAGDPSTAQIVDKTNVDMLAGAADKGAVPKSASALESASAADIVKLDSDGNKPERVLPDNKMLPLSQSDELANRNLAKSERLDASGKPLEPTFLKQSALNADAESNGLSLDDLKQMMQERKALQEGGGSAKQSTEAAIAAQSDKLAAIEKRLSNGMEGLRQLRIPGEEAKKASADDNASASKQPSFGRALEQMSSIKTEEAKPLSTSISTPPNRPGFVPEFNQRIMMMIGQKIQSAEIQLNPEELGSIDVSIKFNQDQQASIVFASQHAVTREALEQGAQRLRDMLEDNGIDLENVDIQENLTRDRSEQGNEKEAELTGNASGQSGEGGTADDSDESAQSVATIETDSLVDFYA